MHFDLSFGSKHNLGSKGKFHVLSRLCSLLTPSVNTHLVWKRKQQEKHVDRPRPVGQCGCSSIKWARAGGGV